jgi:predicted Zn-dependent peptidase
MAGTFVLRNSTPAGIIAQLNFLDQYGLPDTYLTNYVKNVHAVTPEKISEIIKNTLVPGKMLRVMVGDKDAIEKQIGAAKKGF